MESSSLTRDPTPAQEPWRLSQWTTREDPGCCSLQEKNPRLSARKTLALVTAQVSDRCSQLALAEEGWAGRDSSRGAQLGLTGQGVLVAAILLAAAPLGTHVVLMVHSEAEES